MSHPRTTTGLLAGLVAAGTVGWVLGGAAGTGTVLGFLLGGALAGFGVAWQGHWLRVRPARALQAQVEAFLAKLALLTAFALAFRYVDVLGERVDWRAFVVAYAAAVGLLLPLGTWESARSFSRGAERRGAPPAQPTRSAL